MSTASRQWSDWSTTVSIVTDCGPRLDEAVSIAREVMHAVEMACSRFRDDSELALLGDELDRGTRVSPLLAMLVRNALNVARWTDGSVDPTLGNDLVALGYDRDFALIDSETPLAGALVSSRRRAAGWRRVCLQDGVLTVPCDLRLDLGASAKALTADLVAERITKELDCATLVSLGGDIATGGRSTVGAWEVIVQDLPSDPAQQLCLSDGVALATSSTQKRRWIVAGHPAHHILDPRFGIPVDPVWRSVTVAASSCLRANALSTASIVRGHSAVEWLSSLGADARLVDRAGRVVVTGSWPVVMEQLACRHGKRGRS
jgi:FAD:protein FMN transferase